MMIFSIHGIVYIIKLSCAKRNGVFWRLSSSERMPDIYALDTQLLLRACIHSGCYLSTWRDDSPRLSGRASLDDEEMRAIKCWS